jgi:hypothetical protein
MENILKSIIVILLISGFHRVNAQKYISSIYCDKLVIQINKQIEKKGKKNMSADEFALLIPPAITDFITETEFNFDLKYVDISVLNSECSDCILSRIKSENQAEKHSENEKIFGAFIEWVKENGSTTNTEPQNNTITNTTQINQRQCHSCNGTGLCQGCNKTFKKYYIENCSIQIKSVVNLGYTLCRSCNGFGFRVTNLCAEPNCSNCIERDCLCDNGWNNCEECNSGGKGENLGKCKTCRGTGKW